MQNIKELRESLANNYEKILANEMGLKKGRELANTAGKIISSLRVEMDYNNMIGKTEKIKFLES